MKKNWFRLDNAAILYPAAATKKWSSVFRLSAEMDQEVDPSILQQALNNILPRFPTMKVRVRNGFFWSYLQENTYPIVVKQDEGHPCMRFWPKEDHGHLMRVNYFHNRINLEMSHCLTDGSGAITFLKTLLARYCELCGHTVQYDAGALDYRDTPDPEEAKDAFQTMPLPQVHGKRTSTRAYHYPGIRAIPHTLWLVSACLDGDMLHKKAKEYGATINEYMTAVMLYCACCHQEATQPKRKKMLPVRILVPINLRLLVPTKTLRNFSTFVDPEIDCRLGHYTFEEILKKTKAYLQYFSDPKMLFSGVASNVALQKSWLIRLIPFPLKKCIITAIYRHVGDRTVTADFSNLGRVTLPSGVNEHVKCMQAVMGASVKSFCDCALLTCSGETRLVFTRTMAETDFCREVLCHLVSQGIGVTVRSNREDE